MVLPPQSERPAGPGLAAALVGLAAVALLALAVGMTFWALSGAPLPFAD